MVLPSQPIQPPRYLAIDGRKPSIESGFLGGRRRRSHGRRAPWRTTLRSGSGRRKERGRLRIDVDRPNVPLHEQGILDAIAPGGGPHTFDCNGPTTVATQAEIVIDNDVILDGEGNLTLEAPPRYWNSDLDYFLSHRIFTIESGVTAELIGMTITRGCGRGKPRGY